MTPDARSARHSLVFRLIFIAAVALTVLAVMPVTLSTAALTISAMSDCPLGPQLAGSCQWAGVNLRPILIGAVSWIAWSDLAWDLASLAVILWMIVFVRGVARDIRFLRDPQLPGATSGLRRAYLLIPLTGATIVGFAPIFSVIWSALFSGAFGCTLNEGDVHPCVVAGVDYGDALYQGFVAGWLMLIVWPLALIVLVGWIGVAGYAFSRWMRAGRAR